MAIDRDLGRDRDDPMMPSPGRGRAMRSPGTIDDRARDIAPDGVPFNFYDSGRMDPPSRRFPNPFPDPRFPMPMPLPSPREGLPPRPMPMPIPGPDFGPRITPMPSLPPGMGPFRPQPFPDQMPRGRQGIMEAAAVDPSDFRTIQKLLDAGLDPNDYIQAASMAYDDDDYGPFIPPSVIEMDRFGTGYGPQDEYLFDREKGFENRIFGKDPDYKEMSGIMSALPQETQMAELNDRQRRALGTRVNRFAYDEGISSPQDMLKMISPLDKPSFFGFGGNEANEQDIIDFYKNNTSMVG